MLAPPKNWGFTSWELERLEDEDDTASLWIERDRATRELWYKTHPGVPFPYW